MDPEGLLDQSASSIAKAIADKKVSAAEMTEAAIARIEARDGPINAVVVRDFDRAISAAKAADAAIAHGEKRPLLGVPMTVKESHNVGGLPTTWGFEQFKSFKPNEDSVGVKRLKSAGAIILGKTNVPVGLADWQSVNPIYGRTRNPWNLERSPGGSSGGSAAALAARLVPLEFGSDIGGSIRVPAAFCGVYGHKPSWAIIPSRGQSPPGTDGAPAPLAVIGPMARTAADLEIALGVLAGPDEMEAVGYRLELPPPRHKRLADFRVLILDQHPKVGTESEIRAALDGLAQTLGAAGARVARQSNLLPDLAAAHDIYMPMMLTVMSRGQPGAASPSAHEFMGFVDAQLRIRRQWAALFRDFDVVLAPSLGVLAFPHDDEPDQRKRKIIVDGEPTPFMPHLAWPGVATFPNLPATAVPIGLSRAGLPIGIQIVGPYLEDLTTIEFAKLLEREIGGYRPPPGY
ncbi:MAG: amidase family protein [Alphaproteobacteria bacterium]